MAPPDQLDSGHEGGRHRAKAHHEHPESTAGGPDGLRTALHEVPRLEQDSSLTGQGHEGLVPLRGDPARRCPVLDGALTAAQQPGQDGLSAKAPDYPLGRIRTWGAHVHSITIFSLWRSTWSGRWGQPVGRQPAYTAWPAFTQTASTP